MKAKSIPISVRLPAEDAEFLSNLQIDDAVTPSEKIRALIQEARNYHNLQEKDYADALASIREWFTPIVDHIQTQNHTHKIHSALVLLFTEWLTESTAYFIAQANECRDQDLDFDELENGLADRIFRLFEQVLRLGVTKHAPCYNKCLIQEKLAPLLELTDIVAK